MSDRELLEQAATAYFGADGFEWNSCAGSAGCIQYIPEGLRHYVDWSPLTDDGDALRLACTLGLTIECDFHDSDTCTASQTRGEIVADEQSGMFGEVIGAPEFAATRRAIVRAAAEIGKNS
ncbi:hypothetical protein [Stutzerimonas stutzeri]|uniref:hypothetical protein n=1 Tax=Stutzerimonas stutzeri TaxID=316 RepID=UPI000C9AAC4E|nr:hypothetical protein [Stutzerimonas stutzeri]PNG14008.1 hypothetical protein CXK97_12755 [Stutzerimonas stutzeri]